MKVDRFFSRVDGARIGSFDYGLGLLDATFTAEAMDLFHHPGKAKSYLKRPRHLVKLLLEITSYVHERRHFLDTFGTMAGLSLYSARLSCLKRFWEVGAGLASQGETWKLPLSEWAKDADFPVPVRKLHRLANTFRAGSDMFIASFPRFTVKGHTAEAWIRVPFKPSKNADLAEIPAFPYSVAMAAGGGAVQPFSVVFPIGYEALVEGSAHSLARELVEQRFPAVPKELMAHTGSPVIEVEAPKNEAGRMQALADAISAYGATDFMISKFLRSKGVPKFPRTLVLRLTDIALSANLMTLHDVSETSTKVECTHPGGTMIELLGSTPVDDLKKAKVAYPAVADAAYNATLQEFAKGGDWHTVTHSDSFYAAIRVWESFVAQNVTVPLLKKRLADNHECFSVAHKTLPLLFDTKLSVPEVLNGQIRFGSMPKEVTTAWASQMMLGEIMHQVFADSAMILCPRAHKLLPGMKTLDLSGGGCDTFEKLGCGSWSPGQSDNYMPPCLFTKSLTAYGFIPIAKA